MGVLKNERKSLKVQAHMHDKEIAHLQAEGVQECQEAEKIHHCMMEQKKNGDRPAQGGRGNPPPQGGVGQASSQSNCIVLSSPPLLQLNNLPICESTTWTVFHTCCTSHPAFSCRTRLLFGSVLYVIRTLNLYLKYLSPYMPNMCVLIYT